MSVLLLVAAGIRSVPLEGGLETASPPAVVKRYTRRIGCGHEGRGFARPLL